MSTVHKTEGNGPFVAGLLAGVLLGGIAAGLWAPQSGPQLRQAVRNQTQSFKDQAENVALKAKTTADEVLKHE